MKLRARPDDKYLHQADWEQLYVLAEHWKSNMDFYNDEIWFLKKLIDRFFIQLLEENNIQQMKLLTEQLSELETNSKSITAKIDENMHHLVEFQKNSFSGDEQEYRDEYAVLEDEIAAFVKTFKQLKKDIFKAAEYVMETEKAKHLLGS